MRRKSQESSLAPQTIAGARAALERADSIARAAKRNAKSAKSAVKAAKKALKHVEKAAKKARKEASRARKTLASLLASKDRDSRAAKPAPSKAPRRRRPGKKPLAAVASDVGPAPIPPAPMESPEH